jgi:HIRAN domain
VPSGSSSSSDDAGSAGGKAAGARREDPAAKAGGGRLRIWLERGESGYWLRDAASGDPIKWDDPRVRVVKIAGASYRADALQDDAFAPGRRLALVPEPDNEHDPNAVAVWDAERRLQAGYVPAEVAPELRGDEQAVSLWEFRGEDGERIGLRVLLAPADAWIQEPRA